MNSILYHTSLILIFRPFFIWRWHTKLRDHPLAQRAQAVCTEQAAGVNELFRAYGRLFNFQYQSYLVSYCVYTAATIDVRLMRHDDKTLAEMAADRLAVTLRMLETEVKQTPGIRRSVEIIRSHLGQQWSPDSHHPQVERPPESQDMAIPEKEKWLGISVEPIANDRFHHRPAPPLSTAQDPNLYGSTDSVVAELPMSSGLQSFIDPTSLQIETSWVDWSVDDSGGGFVPDMAYWSPFSQPF